MTILRAMHSHGKRIDCAFSNLQNFIRLARQSNRTIGYCRGGQRRRKWLYCEWMLSCLCYRQWSWIDYEEVIAPYDPYAAGRFNRQRRQTQPHIGFMLI